MNIKISTEIFQFIFLLVLN